MRTACRTPVTYTLTAGQVALRRDKRPRPLVLRVHAGQCLHVNSLLGLFLPVMRVVNAHIGFVQEVQPTGP